MKTIGNCATKKNKNKGRNGIVRREKFTACREQNPTEPIDSRHHRPKQHFQSTDL